VKQSEITLIEAVSMLDSFSPIKITLNGIVLYNDYDSEIEVEPGVFGEIKPWQEVLMERLWQAKDYVITDIKIEIVQYHHSIISMRGKYEPYKKDK
jgi:hypothetical protein